MCRRLLFGAAVALVRPAPRPANGRPFFYIGHMASLGPMAVAGSACVAKRSGQSHRARIEGVSIGLTSAESPSSQSPAASSRRLRAPLTATSSANRLWLPGSRYRACNARGLWLARRSRQH